VVTRTHCARVATMLCWQNISLYALLISRPTYMNLETTRLRGRPRKRWQDEVKEDGRIVGGEGRQEKLHNREE